MDKLSRLAVKQQKFFRLDCITRLLYLGSINEKNHDETFCGVRTMTKRLNAFRLSPELESILSDESLGESKSSVIEVLAADGLRRRMETNAKPISSKWLDRLNPDGIFRMYCAFVNATCAELGLPDKYDLPVKYRFEPTPKNSKYYCPGAETYLVLSEREFVRGDGAIVREID